MNTKPLNTSLNRAAKMKNDEFYTLLSDIEKELKHYKDQFRGKVIFCNCDDPRESNFVKYFSMNFEHLGLKKLIATHYKESTLFTREAPYKLEYTGDKNDNRIPDPDEFVTEMIGTGDFRSKECVELLKEADMVVTNPPFSLFREYVAQLVEYNKKFLIIGNDNARTYIEIFKLIRENKVWSGYERVKEFKQQDGKIKKFGNVGWFTNLDVSKRHEFLTLYKKFSPQEYPKYHNYDAIEVSKVSEIPINYGGAMGVPISFLDKYNPEQFEIIGSSKTLGEPMSKIAEKGSYTQGGPRFYLANKDGTYKRLYDRIVIKHRRKYEN